MSGKVMVIIVRRVIDWEIKDVLIGLKMYASSLNASFPPANSCNCEQK